MVIGVQKSATSTLFNILGTHPQVSPAKKKELFFFNENFEKLRCSPPESAPSNDEFADYLARFPRLNRSSDAITGEFTATYMHCWCCPRAMQRLLPGLRLITQLRVPLVYLKGCGQADFQLSDGRCFFILKEGLVVSVMNDPIERARSRYQEQHNWAKKTETFKTFEEYVERELPPLEHCLQRANNLEGKVHCAAQSNILGLSLYDSALRLWFEHFQPADLLVTYLDHLAVQPQAVVSAIHSHLGVRDLYYSEELLHKKYNHQGEYGWGKAMLQVIQLGNHSVMQRLFHFYRPHLQQLKLLADEGLISKLPVAWIRRWNL